jgi:hypothetical protein
MTRSRCISSTSRTYRTRYSNTETEPLTFFSRVVKKLQDSVKNLFHNFRNSAKRILKV